VQFEKEITITFRLIYTVCFILKKRELQLTDQQIHKHSETLKNICISYKL